ncbi:MAG: hypothetical protein COB23_05370 [Methylophaga sp.]|nr:MAG: hypothetical protein COB23_05370 [Methylophaga sp.]
MKFSQETFSDANYIHAYDSQAIVVRDKNNLELHKLHTDLILTAGQIITDWKINQIFDIPVSDIDFLMSLDPEVLIITTGSNHHFLPPQLLVQFSEKSIGVECMSLGAACRTYNLLIAEGRRVVLLASFD